MEFSVLAAWIDKFMLIIGGCLMLSVFLLLSNNYPKNKLNQMEQDDRKN